MIDPKNITNFNRTEAELQEFLLFCIVVAGKNSHQQAVKLDQFLNMGGMGHLTPFQRILRVDSYGLLTAELMKVKMGQYTRIANAFREVAKLSSLSTVALDDLEKVKGIGSKTSRFFVMHSRPNQRVAVLDTHILKWLGTQLFISVPKATPSDKKKYQWLEYCFLKLADLKGKTPAELDLEIWSSMAKA